MIHENARLRPFPGANDSESRKLTWSSIVLLLATLAVAPVVAHDHPGYWHGASPAGHNPNWMAALPDTRRISDLSIPGTHETMARFGGDIPTAQSMTLRQQLDSGIRAVDIRLRHADDRFGIYHGNVSQNTVFETDVLAVAKAFLIANPSETILMRVKGECRDSFFSCSDGDNTRTFKQTFEWYRARFEAYIWRNPTGTNNPTLGPVGSSNPAHVRGKIVMIPRHFSTAGISYNYSGSPEGQSDALSGNPNLQNRYEFSTNWNLYDKWAHVRDHLVKAASGPVDSLYMNFLSGSEGSFPYFIASGHSSPQNGAPRLWTGLTTTFNDDFYVEFPRLSCLSFDFGFFDAGTACSIYFEGTNVMATNYMNAGKVRGRVGIIMADFPGVGLIESVIAQNGVRMVTNTNDSGAGSLRWAVASNLPFQPTNTGEFSGGTVSFAPEMSGEVIRLSSPIDIDRDISIDASNLPDGITLDGGGQVGLLRAATNPTHVRLKGLTITGGLAEQGGGIYSLARSLEIEGSTFYSNQATDSGGAIYINTRAGQPDGVHKISNSTIANNRSKGGAGIFANTGEMTLEHVTVANNRNDSLFGGAGITNHGILKLANSIVAGNTFGSTGLGDISGDFVLLTANLVQRNTFGTPSGGAGAAQLTADPQLGPLTDNGGPTLTMLPGARSPALGAGTQRFRSLTDQRGEKRPAKADANPVLGAVEIPVGPTMAVFQQGVVGGRMAAGDAKSFASVLPGRFAFLDFGITNLGNATLSGVGVTLDGPDAAMFSLVRSPAASVAPLTGGGLGLRFSPTSPGRKVAAVRIVSNDSENSPFRIVLSGIGKSTLTRSRSTRGASTWNRPDAGAPPRGVSSTATATPYDVVSFTVTNPGEYTLTSRVSNPGEWNNQLFLYSGTFDATMPLPSAESPFGSTLAGSAGGLVEGVDLGVASITANLGPGTRYFVVSTGTTNTDFGDYSLDLTGPGELSAFAPAAIGAPARGQTGVSVYPEFSWTTTPGSTYEVLLGTQPGNLASLGVHESPFVRSQPLRHGTTYYWRLDARQGGGAVSGGIRSFTTRNSIQVTTLLDENDADLGLGRGDSLREAIAAVAAGEASSIDFATELSGGTIRLGGTPLVISTDVRIDAAALENVLSVSGNNASRVFDVAAGATVSMKAIGITEGAVSAGSNGAGVRNRGTLTLTDAGISANRAHTGHGGGIFNLGMLILERSTLASNDARFGGGLYNEGSQAMALLSNVTVTGNTASDGGGGLSNAGDAELDVVHATVTENWVSQGRGAGIELRNGLLSVANSIIAGNDAMEGRPSIDNQGGTVEANGVSIIGDNSSVATTFPSGTFVGTALNPRTTPLSPLDFYDGRTRTRPPLPGSLAFDAATPTSSSPLQDQRGLSRPKGPASDIGAVESELSSNSNLASLTSSAGRLNPIFWSDVTDYAVSVSSRVSSARVRASPQQNQASILVRVNGGPARALAAGEASSELALNAGRNAIDVTVTAENGTTETYTLAVNRGAPAATNTDLASLTTSAGSLRPAFAPAITAYGASVGNSTRNITATPSAAAPGARVDIALNHGEFNRVARGDASAPLALDVGSNQVQLKVTSSDGTTTARHTLKIFREAPAIANAHLSALTTSAGPLTPAFSPEVFVYHLLVREDVGSATVSATSVQAAARIEVRANSGTAQPLANGATSAPLALGGQGNLIELGVTAADGTTVNSYTIVVDRVSDHLEWASKLGNDFSGGSAISADGRYVAFSSRASNLVASDTNNSEDVFVYDRVTQLTERVSVSNSGAQGSVVSGPADSSSPSISADGRYVAFQSRADNLVANDTNGQVEPSFGQDIFVYDRTTDRIERVSVAANGRQGNQASETPSISADGRYVAFASGANNLVDGFENDEVNVYVHDRTRDTLVAIHVPFGDFRSNRSSLAPSISADGALVAFEFAVDRNDDNQDLSYQYSDIYLYHRDNQLVDRIAGDYDGLPSNGNRSKTASISADGRRIAFQSNVNGIDFDDVNGSDDVFVHDRDTGLTERVSVDAAGRNDALADSGEPSISGNGRFVAFQSFVSNLVANDGNGDSDIFMKNLATGELSLLSQSSASVQGAQGSFSPAVSSDGCCVAFRSNATQLASPDTNDASDVFVAISRTAEPDSLAGLASLTSNLGGLDSGFNSGLLSYSASVANEVTTASLQPATADSDSSIQVRVNNGAFRPVDSESLASLPLAVGANAIEFKVTAADGSTTRNYALDITRARSDDAGLARLATSAGDLVPAFASAVTAYTVVVPNETVSLRLTPATTHANARVTVQGQALASGAASRAINLAVGENDMAVVVTAENNSSNRRYELRVVREPSTRAELAGLVPSIGVLKPAFNADTSAYVVEIPLDSTSIKLTPTTAQSGATIAVNGAAVRSGTASGIIDVFPGTNTITTFVTAADGTSTRTYTLDVNRVANRPPVANGQSVIAATARATAIVLRSSDPDGDARSYMVLTQPTKGRLSGTAPNLIYTSNAGASGSDRFTFKVNDGELDSLPATVTITIDRDSDLDGVPDSTDNCASISNGGQRNTDGDSEGDACDADDDNDGISDIDEVAAGRNPKLNEGALISIISTIL